MSGRGALRLRLTCAAQALVLALGGAVAVACDSGHHTSSTVPRVATRPVADGNNKNNKERAQQEAEWLLSLARLLADAQPIRRPPQILSGPITGTPVVSSLVIRSRYWRVPMSYSATLAWLRAHPPRELMLSASGGGVEGPDGSASGYTYSDVPTTGLQSADLEVGATADGAGSAIRVDAVVVWLDPRPMRDTADGGRIRVTVSGGCASNDRGIGGVRNDGRDLSARMVPEARPSGGLLCRYNGLNGGAFRLLASKRLDAGHAVSLANALGRLPLSHVEGGVVNCPMDDAAAAVVALSYPGSDDVDVWVGMNGCAFVSNGQIMAAAGTLPDLILSFG